MDIRSLPPELLDKIYRYLDPASHLDFAIMNKDMFHRSSNIIEHHRKWSRSYHTCTDQSPEAVVSLLRTVAADHIAAWHLRTFERQNIAIRQAGAGVSENELAALADAVRAAMLANDLPVFSLCKVGVGDFEALQTALFAMSSGLHTLKFVNYFPTPDDQVSEESTGDLWIETQMSQQYTEDSAHSFFSNVVRAIHEMLPQPIFPPGFCSLRKIMIGVPFANQPIEPVSSANVAPLFLLPNLSSVYLRGLFVDDEQFADDPFGPNFDLPEKSSSVEHLFLERAGSEEVKTAVNAFIKSAKALKSLVLKECDFNDFDMTIGLLTEDSIDPPNTLNTLLWSDEGGLLHGYRCFKFPPDEHVGGMHAIRVLALDLGDIRLGSLSGFEPQADDGMTGDVGNRADFITYFQENVPRTVETLVLKLGGETLFAGDLRAVNDAIITLIEEDDEEDDEANDEEDDEEDDEADDGDNDEEENTGEDTKEDVKEYKGEAIRQDIEEGSKEDEEENKEWSEEEHIELDIEEDIGEGSHPYLRHIYIDEVVDSVAIEEGKEHEGYSGQDRRAFGRSLFETAALRCKDHSIELHLNEGATKQYFEQVCDSLFNLSLRGHLKT